MINNLITSKMKNLELTNDQRLRLAVIKSSCDVQEARDKYNFIMEGAEKEKPQCKSGIPVRTSNVIIDERFTTRTANIESNLLVFVVNPETGKNVPANQWLQREDKASAEWVGIRNEDGIIFYIHKKEVNDGKDLKFDEIPEAIKAMKLAPWDDANDCAGRRKWWCDVYDAIHTKGLNDLLKEIGGDPIAQKWYWTADKDTDPSYSYDAWVFNGTSGYLYYNRRCSAYGARVFRAF